MGPPTNGESSRTAAIIQYDQVLCLQDRAETQENAEGSWL